MANRFPSGRRFVLAAGAAMALSLANAWAEPQDTFDYRQYESMLGGMQLPSDEQVRQHQRQNMLSMPSGEELDGQLGTYREQLNRAMNKLDEQPSQSQQGALRPFQGAATEEARNAYGQNLNLAQGALAAQVSSGNPDGRSLQGLMEPEAADRLQSLLKQHEAAKKTLENQMKGGTHVVPEDALIVFVSFSMPERVLSNLAEQAREVGAVMVLRGLVDGKLSATETAAMKVNAAGAAWEINPELFHTFDVQTVPAFVLTGNKDVIDQGCAPDDSGQCSPTNTFSKVSGDISIEIALDTIQRRTEIPFIREQAIKRLNVLQNKRG